MPSVQEEHVAGGKVCLGFRVQGVTIETERKARCGFQQLRLPGVPAPPVQVEILEFTLVGPVLAVRPFCHNDNYWQVYFDGNRVIRESLAAADFPAPMPSQMVLVQNSSH